MQGTNSYVFVLLFEDINECDESNPCKDGSTCSNTEGGHRCICPPGYEYDSQNNICSGEALAFKEILHPHH